MEKYFPSYFTEWNAIVQTANDEQIGKIFKNALFYAQGIDPEFNDDPTINVFTRMVIGTIDRSIEKVKRNSRSKRYARYCGVCKAKGTRPLPFADWAIAIDTEDDSELNERQQTSTDDNKSKHQLNMSTNVTSVNNHNQNQNQNGYNQNIEKDNFKKVAPVNPAPAEQVIEDTTNSMTPLETLQYRLDHLDECYAKIKKMIGPHWFQDMNPILRGIFLESDDYDAALDQYRDLIVSACDAYDSYAAAHT